MTKVMTNVQIYYADLQEYKQTLIETREISYPKAETKKLTVSDIYFTPSLGSYTMFDRYVWTDGIFDFHQLRRGLIHVNKEDAIQHTMAVVLNTEGTK